MAAASSAAVKEHQIHVGELTKECLQKHGGRGGGKPNFAQGTAAPDTKAEVLFDTFCELIK